jgi:small nuclear ribonucleoprotein (snRNP)-like protein
LEEKRGLTDRNDGRALVGQMLAYDKHMNFVLAECEEFRTVKVGPISRIKEQGGG